MPTDFVCQTCALHFSIGWFHYHTVETGYGSATMLVCTKCGAQHIIEIGLRDRGPEFREIFAVDLLGLRQVDRIFALRLIRDNRKCSPDQAKQLLEALPVRLVERAHPYQVRDWEKRVSNTSVELGFPVIERTKNESYGPLLPDRLLGAREPCHSSTAFELVEIEVNRSQDVDTIALSLQKCNACSAFGTLTHELEQSAACPQCKQMTLEISGNWIT